MNAEREKETAEPRLGRISELIDKADAVLGGIKDLLERAERDGEVEIVIKLKLPDPDGSRGEVW